MLPLAGCLGFGDDDPEPVEDDCPDHDDHAGHDEPIDGGNATGNETGLALALPQVGFQQNDTGNETLPTETADPIAQSGAGDCPGEVPETPNEPPVPVLKILKDDGSEFGPNDFVLPGATLSFSPQGSSDPDGSIGLASLVVEDGNGSRTVNLIQDEALIDAILKFDHPGPINATLRIIDDRGDPAEVTAMAYVNAQETGTQEAEAFDPTSGGCSGPSDGDLPPLVEETFFAKEPFVVSAGARWISVTTTGTSSVVICDPDGNEMASGDTSAETGDASLASNTQYFLALHPSGPNQTMSYDVIVHFEPKAA